MARIRVRSVDRLIAAGIVLLSATVTLFLVEFAVRLALPAYDPSGHITFIEESGDTPLLGHANTVQRQIKNTGDFDVTVRFNAYGLRDSKDLSKAGKDDLFLVGDSFPFGWGVELRDRLSEQLETLTGRPVYNLSSGGGSFDGYSTMIDYARKKGATIGKTILAVNMENDIHSYDPAEAAAAAKRNDPTGLNFGPRFRVLKVKLMENSALYFMTTTIVHNNAALRGIAVKTGLITPNLKGVKSRDFDPKVILSSANRLKRLMETYPGIAVLIPSRANWVGSRKQETRRIHQSFKDELSRLGVNTLDLLPIFDDQEKPLLFYFKNDAHWNPLGHRLAAEAVAASIQATAK